MCVSMFVCVYASMYEYVYVMRMYACMCTYHVKINIRVVDVCMGVAQCIAKRM